MIGTVKSAFLRHPCAVDESYGQHMAFALRFAGKLFLAALAALVHAVFPFLFERTASRMIDSMHAQIQGRGPSRREQSCTGRVRSLPEAVTLKAAVDPWT
jgi:hypothetical protein